MTKDEINIESIWKQKSKENQDSIVLDPNILARWFKKKPGGIFNKLSAAIKINFFQKCIYVLAQLGLLSLLADQKDAIQLVAFLIIISLILIGLDLKILKKARILQYQNPNLSEKLSNLQFFIKSEYSVYSLYSAFTNPILIITGAIYYDFFKYGRLNIFHSGESIIVFSIFAGIGYLVGYLATRFTIKQIERDIEDYIEQLNSENANFLQIEKIRKRRIRNIIIMFIIMLIGCSFFVFLWKLNQL